MEIELTDMAPTGEAIGRHEGMVVFVPFGLAGERVEIDIVHRRRSYARGKLKRVVRTSDARVAPRCKYFAACGGCEWQHATYDFQLTCKTHAVHEQLVRIGKLTQVTVRHCLPSPGDYGYRNHAQFVLSSRGRPGYYAAGSREIVEVDSCPVLDLSLGDLLDPDSVHVESVPRATVAARAGGTLDSIREVHLRAGVRTGEREIVLEQSDGRHIVVTGPPTVHERVGLWDFRISPESFFQVNTPASDILVAQVLDALTLTGEETVLDLFCGVGLFTVPISQRARYVLGVESNPTACADAVHNLAGCSTAQIITADVGAAVRFAEIRQRQWNAVILDPPRSGVQPETLNGILELRPRQIVYVSCDPATLARDSRAIVDTGYEIDRVQPIDLFPQTHHVETVMIFTQMPDGYIR